jgi:hypothetical protein
MDKVTFAVNVLHGLGIKPNRVNTAAMVGWMNAEGGHWKNDAKFNPLNTTLPMRGAGNTGTQGNIKVYRDWNQGIAATVKTLKNGRYSNILNALQGNNLHAIGRAVANSPWGTGGLAERTIDSARPLSSVPSSSSIPNLRVGGVSSGTGSSTHTVTELDPEAQRRVALAQFLQSRNPNNLLLRTGAISVDEPIERTRQVTTPSPGAPPTSSDTMGAGARPSGHSPLFELIHNTGNGPGFAVKNGQVVNGANVYGAVWEGHKNHVHLAAGPKTVVRLGKIAQSMGLHVGENPAFGGVHPVHAPHSYHYKNEAIDVSGEPTLMNKFSRYVERYFGIEDKSNA